MTVSKGERETLYRRASEMVMSDLAIIPLHHQVSNWGMAPTVTYHPMPGAWQTDPEMFRWVNNAYPLAKKQ
ncbi:hypothetical protein CS022_24345 [Veronia nyctiphanis]|uniref:Uncharacterized protein n=1 Tax=Veronia nyctiphanis TaxID=1278244 RepID=A0A4Q0YDV1_9GAMM|nr:hypothetical protein [Veronia nyctiphanis]RXJ67764.1 hypothetical protein CS022_24345 [Veronia nyctiphanis]